MEAMMLLDIASNKLSLSLLDIDRDSIPDPWDDSIIECEETPAIVSPPAPVISKTTMQQLPPAPDVNAATVLIQGELKLNRKVDPPLFIRLQDLLAQLYWADSICEG